MEINYQELVQPQAKFTDGSSQTEEDLIYNYAWQKFYHHFQSSLLIHNLPSTSDASSNLISTQSEKNPDKTDKTDTNWIKELAENALESRGLVYDSKSGFYFDSQNGLFYDQEKRLYIDIDSSIYYHFVMNEKTQQYHLRYHSKMKRKEHRKSKKHKKSKKSSTEKEFIYLSNTSEEESKDDDVIDLTTKYPPCVRAILLESNLSESDSDNETHDKLGSLYLIPCTGGSIGRARKNLISFSAHSGISDVHATISYDLDRNSYFIKDEMSLTGTFVNESKLEPLEKNEIKHLDMLSLGSSLKFALHIHSGKNTCVNCEPGEVMHRFQLEKQAKNVMKRPTSQDLNRLRNETAKSIKKKYGLKWDNMDAKVTANRAEKIIDRAKERREKYGSELPSSQKVELASASRELSENNIGRKMLAKMGWKEGKGLGKLENGIVEPIQAKVKWDNSGIGKTSAPESSINNVDESQRKKVINWSKTVERYKVADRLAAVFNDDDDEDVIEIKDTK